MIKTISNQFFLSTPLISNQTETQMVILITLDGLLLILVIKVVKLEIEMILVVIHLFTKYKVSVIKQQLNQHGVIIRLVDVPQVFK